jgi:hypothetical protein
MNTVAVESNVRTRTWHRTSAQPLVMPMPTRKSGIDEANEDIKAGRVYTAKNGEDLIRQCLA